MSTDRSSANSSRPGFSLFPAFAENYSDYVRWVARTRRPSAVADFITAVLVPAADRRFCGFQPVQPTDAALIRQSEQWLCEGTFEPFLKAREKYDEFAARLRTEPGFRRDWRALKKVFPRETAQKGILHRTLIPERNWVRDGGAKFKTRAQRFQAAFDLLCWKYCLWGVARGRPLLLKPSVVVTPHGTQIFIPAYLSFDAKRDLNLGLITRLHRARGQLRQGDRFMAARMENASLRRRAKAADALARKRGLKGDARYRFICQEIGLLDHGDYRQLRRLLHGRQNSG